ncbi:MAG: fasciclin domain-containing protein [Enterobacter sp.]
MSSLGPSTNQPTLLFQDTTSVELKPVIKSGTVLDYISKNFPYLYSLIERENLQHYYNDELTNCTIFIPINQTELNPKTITINKRINTILLSTSEELFLPSLSFDSVKVNYKNNIIYINDKPILFGDIMCINGIIHVVENI